MTENWPARYPEHLKKSNQGVNHKRPEDPQQKPNWLGNGDMSPEMSEFYKSHDRYGQTKPDLPYRQDDSTLLDPQETTSPNSVKGTYRYQFMQGKEEEYEVTERALRIIDDENGTRNAGHLDNCRRFAYFARDKVTGDVRVMTDSCRLRWCPMCAGQKSKYAKESTQRYIESLERPRFLTLTLRNEPGDLLPQIQFLQDCFKRLRQKAYWKRNVTGGIWFLQVKRGKESGCWHPHFHILLDGNYMEQTELSALWDLVTYGSPVIDIRCIHDPADSAKYVARYSARPANLADMKAVDRCEVIRALRGKRLSGTFGTGKCVTLTPPKIEPTGEWQHIGYYNKVVEDSLNNLSAKAILMAWQSDSALAESDYKAYTSSHYETELKAPEPQKPKQYYLDFFNTS